MLLPEGYANDPGHPLVLQLLAFPHCSSLQITFVAPRGHYPYVGLRVSLMWNR